MRYSPFMHPSQTLMELQRRKKQLAEVEAQYIMLQTLDAVKYMHTNSIIHRDLKLGNLFLNENMVCSLVLWF